MGSMRDKLLQSKRDRLADLQATRDELASIISTLGDCDVAVSKRLRTMMRKIDGVIAVIENNVWEIERETREIRRGKQR